MEAGNRVLIEHEAGLNRKRDSIVNYIVVKWPS